MPSCGPGDTRHQPSLAGEPPGAGVSQVSPGFSERGFGDQGECQLISATLILTAVPPDDDCTNTFTPNQVARMHCYLDLVYQRWSQSKKPAPIPIPPMVTGQTQDSLSIYWLPPISGVIHER